MWCVFWNGFWYMMGALAFCVAVAGIFVATLLTIKFLATLEYKHRKK
jgi:hypothetical protein